jgi:hypothetical protein
MSASYDESSNQSNVVNFTLTQNINASGGNGSNSQNASELAKTIVKEMAEAFEQSGSNRVVSSKSIFGN